MGATFSSIQVRSDSQKAVVESLRGLLKEPAYVAPAVGGWVGVYPEGGRTDPDKLAKQLSAKLACGVFHWSVHDSDVFYYSLYESGRKRDEFESDPDYFEPVSKAEKARLRGKPEALVPYCLPGIGYAQVQEVLQAPPLAEGETNAQLQALMAMTSGQLPADLEQMRQERYLSADAQAGDLARLLGIDEQLEMSRYRHIAEANGEFGDRKFVFISSGDLSPDNLRKKLWELPMQAEDIKAAISLGADVNERTPDGEPFLVLAAFNCAAGVVRVLLDAGADVNAATTKRNKHGWEDRGVSALMAAVQGGANAEMGAAAANTAPQMETVQSLIRAGADVNAKTETEWTALKEAQENLERYSTRKSDRLYSEEVLAECSARNTSLIELLRTAGATE